jgi:hypothetical protein
MHVTDREAEPFKQPTISNQPMCEGSSVEQQKEHEAAKACMVPPKE